MMKRRRGCLDLSSKRRAVSGWEIAIKRGRGVFPFKAEPIGGLAHGVDST